MGPSAEVVRQIAVVGEVAEKVETPNGNNQPQTGIGRTGEAPADAPRSIGRGDRRMPAGAERPEKQPRSEARMDFEGRRQQREQQRADRLPGIGPADRRFGPRIPGPGIVVGPAGFALVPRPAPGRGDASGAPRELQRDGDPALDIGRDQQVQSRAESDIGVSVAGIVDRQRLHLGSGPGTERKLHTVAQAQFMRTGKRSVRRIPRGGEHSCCKEQQHAGYQSFHRSAKSVKDAR